jgi:citronellyl-CoA dehydrogenase
LVPTNLRGFKVSRKLDNIGNHSSDTAELAFEEVRVPKRYLLGEENQGFMYLMQNFQTERLIACATACAGLAQTLDASVAFGRERMAWQQKFVDLYTKLEAGRALTYKAAAHYNHERYEQRAPVSLDTVKLISMAKVFVGEMGSEVVDQCLQFHGGAGYIEEYEIARVFRDNRLFRIGGGTTETMRYYLAKLMGM